MNLVCNNTNTNYTCNFDCKLLRLCKRKSKSFHCFIFPHVIISAFSSAHISANVEREYSGILFQETHADIRNVCRSERSRANAKARGRGRGGRGDARQLTLQAAVKSRNPVMRKFVHSRDGELFPHLADTFSRGDYT